MSTTAAAKSHFTTREAGRIYGVPDWAVRRAVDALEEEIPRCGLYRMIPAELMGKVRAKLEEMGYRPKSDGAA